MRGSNSLTRCGWVSLCVAAALFANAVRGRAQCPSASGLWDFGELNQEAHGVAVSGDYAYVADDYGLTVYDVSGLPTVMKKKGEYLMESPAEAVVVSGDYAYVADGWAGLVVLDISTPTAPVLVDSWSGSGLALDVAVTPTIAVVAGGGSGLFTFELQPGGHVSYKATWTTSGSAQGVTLVEDSGTTLAYVANGGEGLAIVDVSNPASPTEQPGVDTPDWALDVAVSGDSAYVADRFDGLQIVDLNPSGSLTPEIVGSVDTDGSATAVALKGTYALVADDSDHLVVIDVANPTKPQVEAVLATPGASVDVVVSGDDAFIADVQGGLQVADVTDPTAPSLEAGFVTAGRVEDLTINAFTGYVADGYGGLQIVDLSVPAAPSFLGACDVGGPATGVAEEIDWAFLSVLGQGLAVVNTSTPSAPVLDNTLSLTGVMYGLSLYGDTVYVAAGPAGVHFVDVSDPQHPARTATVPTPANALAVTADADYAYVAVGTGGLAVVDASGVVGTLDTAGYASSVAVLGENVLLGDGGTLRVISVADPAHPQEVGTLSGLPSIHDLQAPRFPAPTGTTIVYVAAGQSFFAVDLSDPAAPAVLASQPTVRTARVVGVGNADSNAWIGNEPLLEGIDISCPTCVNLGVTADPTEIQTGGETSTITVTVRDLAGKPASGATVTGTTTLGTLSAFSPTGTSGEYRATLTSGASSGEAVITVSVDGTTCDAGTSVRIACAAGDPPTPSGVTATTAGDDSIDLDWLDMAGASGYRVYRGAYLLAELSGGASSAFTDTGLSSGTEYCYTVTSLDPCGGETAPSAEVCATTTGQAFVCPWDMKTLWRPEESSAGYYAAETLDDLLFLADEHGFSVGDVSDPSDPVFLSHWEAPGEVEDIQVRSDGLAVVRIPFHGAALVDVTDPENPFLLGSISHDCVGLALAGDSVFLARHSLGFEVADISDPADPVIVHWEAQPADVLAVSDSRLYAYSSGSGTPNLFAYDVSDPVHPSLLGSCTAEHGLSKMAVSGTYLYGINRSGNILDIYDISGAAPVFRGTYTAPDDLYDLEVAGDIVYLAAKDAGLDMVDVADPTSPTHVGTWAGGGGAYSVALSGTTAFVGDPATMFDSVDVSDPGAPVLLWSGDRDGRIWDVTISGSLAYVTLNPDGLVIVDVDDPWDAVPRGSITTPGEAHGVAASGSYAYVADGSNGLQIVDVSDPDSPLLGARVATTDARRLRLVGDTVYLADDSGGLRIIDVTDPTDPSLAGTWSDGHDVRDVEVRDHYAFVADDFGGLAVVDVGVPSAPSLVTSVSGVGSAECVTISGDLLFLGKLSDESRIYDISDPTNPVEIPHDGHVFYEAPDAVFEGTTVYLTDFDRFSVFDLSDPTTPVELVRVTPPDEWLLGLDVNLGTAYLADSSNLQILSLSCTYPVAGFDVIDRGLMQDFHDTSFYAGDDATYAWDFGDGGTSSQRNPTHTYALPGNYMVHLTVTNGYGSGDVTHFIRVGCDLNHDGPISGPDVVDELAEIYDDDGILASEAGGPDHLGSSQYDTNADGILDGADLAWIIRRAP